MPEREAVRVEDRAARERRRDGAVDLHASTHEDTRHLPGRDGWVLPARHDAVGADHQRGEDRRLPAKTRRERRRVEESGARACRLAVRVRGARPHRAACEPLVAVQTHRALEVPRRHADVHLALDDRRGAPLELQLRRAGDRADVTHLAEHRERLRHERRRQRGRQRNLAHQGLVHPELNAVLRHPDLPDHGGVGGNGSTKRREVERPDGRRRTRVGKHTVEPGVAELEPSTIRRLRGRRRDCPTHLQHLPGDGRGSDLAVDGDLHHAALVERERPPGAQ